MLKSSRVSNILQATLLYLLLLYGDNSSFLIQGKRKDEIEAIYLHFAEAKTKHVLLNLKCKWKSTGRLT